jgi:heme/copper-type cytochrome/quinol oxidase subunit 2
MAFGIAIFSGYYFSIFLNLIRGFRWNYRGNENEKDMDYYMFGGATPTIALWIVITTIILYFKL